MAFFARGTSPAIRLYVERVGVCCLARVLIETDARKREEVERHTITASACLILF